MTDCERCLAEIPLSVDGEMSRDQEASFFAHLKKWPECSRMLAGEQALSALTRSSRQAIVAPTTLRERVTLKLSEATGATDGIAPGDDYSRLSRWQWIQIPSWQFKAQRTVWSAGLAALGILAVSASYWMMRSERDASAERFVQSAVSANQILRESSAKLDVSSSSPSVVKAYMATRVPFPFRMPNDGIATDDRAEYVLSGGSLTSFKDKPAALLAFRIHTQLISILIAPEAEAHTMPGKAIHSGDIDFYSENIGGRHVVTWKNKKLIYALVSDQQVGGSNNCSSCHRAAPNAVTAPLSTDSVAMEEAP